MTDLHNRDPGVVGAALTSVQATAEIIADGIHVHPAAIRVAVNAMPHRIALVTDAMRACGLADGTYSLYDYEVTVADGAARLADGTLAGSVLTMDAAVKNMIELAGLPIETVLPLATEVPARIAGVHGKHRASYSSYMRRHVFDHVDIDPRNTHIPDGNAPDAEAECRRYEGELRAAGGLGLTFLGLGRNGHIGFNEPGTPFDSRT